MDKDLIVSSATSALTNTDSKEFQQNGEKIYNIGNVTNMVIHLSSGIPGSKEFHNTHATICRDYYNLIVKTGLDVTGYSCTVSMQKNRSLVEDIVPELKSRYASLSPEVISEIKSFPLLLMNENEQYGIAAEDQQAYIGVITAIRILSTEIRLECHILQAFPQSVFNDNLELFDLGGTKKFNELNRTHWTIKNIDLIETLTMLGHKVSFL